MGEPWDRHLEQVLAEAGQEPGSAVRRNLPTDKCTEPDTVGSCANPDEFCGICTARRTDKEADRG